MPAPGPHALSVNADKELALVENLRELRLALDVMRMFLPVADGEPGREILAVLHDQLCAEEDQQLRSEGVPDRYLIIRPVSPINPPPPQDMDKITAAVRTLAEFGMLAGRGDTH
jgi:hypothetical protein